MSEFEPYFDRQAPHSKSGQCCPPTSDLGMFSNVTTCVRKTFLAEIANSLKDNLRLCFHPR